jgi:hypothetical protein
MLGRRLMAEQAMRRDLWARAAQTALPKKIV